MKRKAGNLILGLFVAVSVAGVFAQTTIPCPPYCAQKYLEAEYGTDWHIYYMLFGCWMLPESCLNGATAPAFALTQRNVRFR